MRKLNLNSEVAATPAAGSAGHRPVPGGDPPLETGRVPELSRTSVSTANVLPVPSGQWPDGTGGSPVLPVSISEPGLNKLGLVCSLVVLLAGAAVTLRADPLPGLYFTNAVLLPNGFAQFELRTPSTNMFTLQYSFDLLAWNYWTTLGGTNRHVVQTPGPISEVGNTVFVRAAPFGQAMNRFTFDFRRSWNGPLVNGSPALAWPQSLDSWQATLDVGNTTNFPAASLVKFNGPAGGGLVNLPVEFWPDDDYSGTYESDIMDLPPAPPGGMWTVAYGGTNLSFNQPDPQPAGRFAVVAPSFVVSNGLLTSFSWTWRNPSTGANLGSRPAQVRNVEFTLYGPDFAQCSENDYDIFYQQFTDASVTNCTVSPPIPWDNPLWQIEYKDDLNNTYTLNYAFGNLYEVYGANSFSGVDCDPTVNGFTLLGSATNTATFTGSYNYYLVRAPKHNVVKIDTVRGSNGSYYGTSYTGNAENYLSLGGAPDGLYATLGQTPRGFYTGGFFVVNANGHGLSSITVHAVP